jgi:hypothetical protein
MGHPDIVFAIGLALIGDDDLGEIGNAADV